MCILRYVPAIFSERSNTTAVLWYRPAARRSNKDATTTSFSSAASLPMRSVDGPGIDSARSNSSTDSCWQKYGPLCNSCSNTSCAPAFAASRKLDSIASRLALTLPRSRSCSSATLRFRLVMDKSDNYPQMNANEKPMLVAFDVFAFIRVHSRTALVVQAKTPAGSCMVMQCRLPFCQISGRQGIRMTSRPGCASAMVCAAASSTASPYAGTSTAPLMIR